MGGRKMGLDELFIQKDTVLTLYTGQERDVVIPPEITCVARYVFYRKNMKSVKMPDTLTRLEEGAFRSCRHLRNIRFSGALAGIDRYVFADCWQLEQVQLPVGLQKIDDYAFHSTALKEVNIPDTVTEIGEHAFDTRQTLRTAVIPASVRTIGRDAFCGSSDLEIHAYPGSTAEAYARKNRIRCVLLTETKTDPTPDPRPASDAGLLIENGELTGILGQPEDLVISESVTSIRPGVTGNIHSLKRLTLPRSLTRIGEQCFVSCANLEQITFPDTLKEIGDGSFSGCKALERLVLPEGLETIGSLAFSDCTNLTSVRIPGTVCTIGEKAFEDCANLTIYTDRDCAADVYAKEHGIRVSYANGFPHKNGGQSSGPSENLPGNVRRVIYETLTSGQKHCYRLMVEGLMRMDSQIDLKETRNYVLEIGSVWKAVELDFPEIFWVDWNKTATRSTSRVSPVYWITREQREQRQKELDAAAAQFLSGISPFMEDYDKALQLFRRLLNAVDYDSVGLARQKKIDWWKRGVDDLRTVYGALVKKQCVCVGYAVAYQYLLQSLGMEAVQRVGWKIEDEKSGHAWTIVKMDGEYYHVDVTHADGSNTDPQKNNSGYSMCHFGVTDKEIDKIWKPGDKRLPRCTATKCNYFVREGLYFDAFDKDRITAALGRKMKDRSENQIELKLKNTRDAEAVYNWLRDSGILFRLRDEAGRTGEISLANEKYNVIKVLL